MLILEDLILKKCRETHFKINERFASFTVSKKCTNPIICGGCPFYDPFWCPLCWLFVPQATSSNLWIH